MKKFKIIVSGILGLALLCVGVGCGGETNKPDDNPPTPETPIKTEYLAEVSSPDYPAISEAVEYTTYYIDATNGNDSNSGLSEAEPKASLDAANAIISSVDKNEPTRILFKAGSEYSGTLKIAGFEAAEVAPMIVDVYGKTDALKYAKIDGGENNACVEVNGGNVRVSSLECTAPKGYRGIHVTTAKGGALENLVISGNYCHDINYNLEGITLPTDGSMPDRSLIDTICPNSRFSYNCGGIILEADTSLFKGPSWYENVWIENNIVERVARTGIWVFSNWAQRPGVDWGKNHYYDDETNWYPHYNVNVRGNKMLFTGGDGMVIGVTKGGFIENNYCFHAQYLGRPNYYCAGIWIHSCQNVVMQYNEASYTHTGYDGQGFDIDIGCENILFQYNYSHHNDGGGLLMCNTSTLLVRYDKDGNEIYDEDGLPIMDRITAPWSKVYVRNNVFADNDVAHCVMSGEVNDIYIDNNTFLLSGNKAGANIFQSKTFGVTDPGDNWYFRNNIFAMRKTNSAAFDMSFSKTYTFGKNVFYGFEDSFAEYMDTNFNAKECIILDPEFAQVAAEDGLDAAKKYAPKNTAFFDGGNALETMLEKDFAGNTVPKKYYFGAIYNGGI